MHSNGTAVCVSLHASKPAALEEARALEARGGTPFYILRLGSWEEVHTRLRVEGWDGRTLRCRRPSVEEVDAWVREGRGYQLACQYCHRRRAAGRCDAARGAAPSGFYVSP